MKSYTFNSLLRDLFDASFKFCISPVSFKFVSSGHMSFRFSKDDNSPYIIYLLKYLAFHDYDSRSYSYDSNDGRYTYYNIAIPHLCYTHRAVNIYDDFRKFVFGYSYETVLTIDSFPDDPSLKGFAFLIRPVGESDSFMPFSLPVLSKSFVFSDNK